MTNNTNSHTEWVTVPRLATDEMLDRGHHQIDFDRSGQNTEQLAHESHIDERGCGTTIETDMRDAWAAMIEAAPPAPEAGARRPLTDKQIKDGWEELLRTPRVPVPLFKHGVRWAELAHGIGGPAQVEQPERKGVEWLPIATAPKDGTAVLVALPDCDVPHPARCHGTSGWHISWDGHELSEWEQPTHWQPLPAPPAGTNTTEG